MISAVTSSSAGHGLFDHHPQREWKEEHDCDHGDEQDPDDDAQSKERA